MTTHLFLTIFPNLIKPYFEDSILGRAVENGLLEVECIDPRIHTTNKHRKVDDYQSGGGAGMLMSPQPMFYAIDQIKQKHSKVHIVACTPAGKRFVQNDAKRLARYQKLLFICGRYEGVDERVYEKYADELFSIGDFVLTGGELAALSMSDAIARNIENVLGSAESLELESFEDGLLEAPAFTKPTLYDNIDTPSILLKGNHARIANFKRVAGELRTAYYRPDLYKKYIRRNS